MLQTEMKDDDARQQDRTDALTGAVIVFGPGRTRLRCLITNSSFDGAEIEVHGDTRVPDRFVLEIPGQGASYRAEVRWREAGRMGLALHARSEMFGPELRIVA